MLTILFYLIASLLSAVAVAAPAPNQGTNMVTATITTKPGCPSRCGNLTIPYPFGIGPACSLNPFYSLTCNTSFDPHKAFLTNPTSSNYSEIPRTIHELIDISETQFRVRNMVLYNCHNPINGINRSEEHGMSLPSDSPFVFSATANKIVVIGCGYYSKFVGQGQKSINLCSSYCNRKEDVIAGHCSGSNGCKEDVIINNVVREYFFFVSRPRPDSISYDRCGYTFMGESNTFKFGGISDFDDPNVFVERTLQSVPLVVDWVIGNQTCKEARKHEASYGCQQNATCVDANSGIGGYRCRCRNGFEGNPYLPPGCSGFGISIFCIVMGVSWIYLMIRKHRSIQKREKLFSKNGGLLLKRQLSSICEGGTEPVRIFTEKDLKMATNNFRDDCIAGRGGHGIVYKGILEDNSFIAIKKSVIVEESQVEQFINELVILSQINHRNVVKLLGCCLEVEVPLLIYEFIPNGALFNHIHNGVHGSWLDWPNCVRVVSEIANALEYLHCSAFSPIIHRDIKSANILLDQNYTAKVSDFGGSRVIPVDQTKCNTAVQGTLGYLDPEYLFTSELTEKSDVYSFGVLVAEMLTRKKAVFALKGSEFHNLATYFVESMKKDQLLSILSPQVSKKAPIEEVMFLAEIVNQCLSLRGEDRPTMKDIAVHLDRLSNVLRH
ncbi:hypothetical protein RND81_03G103100 [Saponaria officinalis]|uniref:Protein kinase domain-containing protein n=1 Tax=Saponaria officinalis TaxID=3572 RepID=A0AAW1M5E0_SAPOF